MPGRLQGRRLPTAEKTGDTLPGTSAGTAMSAWHRRRQLSSELRFHPMALPHPMTLLHLPERPREQRVEREGGGHPYCPSSLPSSLLAAAVPPDVELSAVLITAQPYSLVPLEAKEAPSQEASTVAKTRAFSPLSPSSHKERDSSV